MFARPRANSDGRQPKLTLGSLKIDVLPADLRVSRRQLRPDERADQRDQAAQRPDEQDQDRLVDSSRSGVVQTALPLY
jgi:hypothetical protein